MLRTIWNWINIFSGVILIAWVALLLFAGLRAYHGDTYGKATVEWVAPQRGAATDP